MCQKAMRRPMRRCGGLKGGRARARRLNLLRRARILAIIPASHQPDTLNGGEVLPGFTCRVAELFV